MKSKPKICRNCAYCDDTPIKMWCSYWVATIGSSRATVACSKYKEKEDEDDLQKMLDKIPFATEKEVKEMWKDD